MELTSIQLEGFNAAKAIALSIGKGLQRRGAVNGKPVNYTGCKTLDGRMWVFADSTNDLKSNTTIDGKPAKQVFGLTLIP